MMVFLHAGQVQAAALHDGIRMALRDPATEFVPQGTLPQAVAALRSFYEGRDFQPLWSGSPDAMARREALLAVLQRADSEGLVPLDYLHAVPPQTSGEDLVAQARAELQTSVILLRYIRDLKWGRSWLVQFDPSLYRVERAEDWTQILDAAARTADLERFLQAQAPESQTYLNLKDALFRYQAFASGPPLEPVPTGNAIRPGSRDPRIPLVRARLEGIGATSPYRGTEPDRDLYDAELGSAVEALQRRFGLTADGIIGRATLRAINRAPAQLAETISLNMERLRWMPEAPGERYVRVNIAAFSLLAVDGSETLEMRAIVGTPYRMTPVFSDRIRYLEFNPYWTVPRRIVVEDLLPKIRNSPGYLQSQNIRIFDGWDENAVELRPEDVDWQAVRRGSVPYRFRQEPGPHNALGRVKFMFPNKYDVYIHDTPSRALFQQDSRPFSSGCIRVERPLELAAFLLRHEAAWNVQKLQALIDSGVTSRVYLAENVPVHLTYETAWPDTEGQIHFREDIYGRDRILAEAVKRH